MDRRELFGPDPRFAVTSPSVSATFSLPSSSLGSPPAFRWSHLPWKYSLTCTCNMREGRGWGGQELSQIGQRQLQICQGRHGLRYVHFDEMTWQQEKQIFSPFTIMKTTHFSKSCTSLVPPVPPRRTYGVHRWRREIFKHLTNLLMASLCT